MREESLNPNEKLYDAITDMHDELIEKAENYNF